MDDRLKRFKVLAVSLMGTAINHETGIKNYIKPLADKAGVSLAVPAMLESFGWAEERQLSLTPQFTFSDMLAPVYLEIAGVLGLPTDGSEAEEFRVSIPEWPPFPDAIDALARLGRHFRLVAFTNADNLAYWSMAKALGEPFADKVTSEDVGAAKPDAQMFAYLRGQQSVHGFNRGDILHISQSQFHDIAIAKELGYATAWIERRKVKQGYGATPSPAELVEPDFHFRDLSKLADAVDQVFDS
jgi:putative hydrolase of the HAD superfamily